MREFQLPVAVIKRTLYDKFPEEKFERKISLSIGSVQLVVMRRIQRPRLCKFILDKKIADGVASKILMLDCNSVFAFETIVSNAAVFRHFNDAVCLNNILKLRFELPFEPDHVLVLATDIMSGIRALYNVGLQRNTFNEMDILLVRRRHHDECFFQIAGIENCTQLTQTHRSNACEELASLASLLKLIKEYLTKEVNKTSYFMQFYRQLETLIVELEAIRRSNRSVGETVKAAEKLLPVNDYSELRKEELPIYLLYSKVFGTALRVPETV